MDYSLLLIVFKKSQWNDDEGTPAFYRDMKRSIYIKETPGGHQEIEIEELGHQANQIYQPPDFNQLLDQDVQPSLPFNNRNSLFDNFHHQDLRNKDSNDSLADADQPH